MTEAAVQNNENFYRQMGKGKKRQTRLKSNHETIYRCVPGSFSRKTRYDYFFFG